MAKTFEVSGMAGEVALSVSGVLDGQTAFPTSPPYLLRASSPPGGTNSLVLLTLANADQTHDAVAAAVAQSELGPIPDDAHRAELTIGSHAWPAWVTKQPSLAPRFVARLWMGVWPEQPGCPGVLLVRARDINADDDPLHVFGKCPVVQSIRVSLG